MRSKITLIIGKWKINLLTSVAMLTARRRTTAVIGASIGSACSIYILVAITGYLSFGNKVIGNIVSMCKHPLCHIYCQYELIILDLPSVASTIGKAAIVILVMFSYPLQV